MSLRAADKKDEHGWMVLDAETGELVGHATSRDKARKAAGGAKGFMVPVASENGQPEAEEIAPIDLRATLKNMEVGELNDLFEVLPADDSPEAVAARAAWDVDQRIKSTVRIIHSAWVDLAEALYLFHEEKMWTALGYETWTTYLNDPDVGIEYKWAMDHLAIYRQLVVDRGVEPERLKQLKPSNVVRVLPAIRRDYVTVEQGLADAEALQRSDLEAKYQGKFQPNKSRRGQPDTSSMIHTDSEPTWAMCPTCHRRGQVDPETGEFIRS